MIILMFFVTTKNTIKNDELVRKYVNNKHLLFLYGAITKPDTKNNELQQSIFLQTKTFICTNTESTSKTSCPNKTINFQQFDKSIFYQANDKTFVEEEHVKTPLCNITNIKSASKNNDSKCKTCGKVLELICEEILFEYFYVIKINNFIFQAKAFDKIQDENYLLIGYFERNARGMTVFNILNWCNKNIHLENRQLRLPTNIKVETYLSKCVEEFLQTDITVELKALFIIANIYNVKEQKSNDNDDNVYEKKRTKIIIFTNDVHFVKNAIRKFLHCENKLQFTLTKIPEKNENTIFIINNTNKIPTNVNLFNFITFHLNFDQRLEYSYDQKEFIHSFANIPEIELTEENQETIKEIYIDLKKTYKDQKTPSVFYNIAENLFMSFLSLTNNQYSNGVIKRVLIKIFKSIICK